MTSDVAETIVLPTTQADAPDAIADFPHPVLRVALPGVPVLSPFVVIVSVSVCVTDEKVSLQRSVREPRLNPMSENGLSVAEDLITPDPATDERSAVEFAVSKRMICPPTIRIDPSGVIVPVTDMSPAKVIFVNPSLKI